MITNINIRQVMYTILLIFVALLFNVNAVFAWGADPGGGCCGGDDGWGGDSWGGDSWGGDSWGVDDGGDSWTPQPTPKPTCSISAEPNPVDYDGTVTLSWSTNNATGASINGVGYVQVGSGSMELHNIREEKTYTMTVTGAGGTNSCSVTVEVKLKPSCTLTASPSTVDYNGNTTLTWTTQNASSASINNGVGTVGLSGSYSVSGLTATKTYTMTVNGNGTSATCSATVSVNSVPAPSCTIDATPSRVEYGDYTTLVWSTSNAVSAEITGIGSVSLSGSKTKKVYSDKTYKMTVKNEAGETATCRVRVRVEDEDTSCRITASPNPSRDGTVTLSWDSDNATWATLNHGIGSVSVDGTKTITGLDNGTHVYTLTVGSSHATGRTDTCSVTVRVNKQTEPTPQPSCTLTASRTYIKKGEGTTLYWTSQNAKTLIFADNGTVASSGSRVVYPTETKYYKLIVTAEDGTQTSCQTLVTVEDTKSVVVVSSMPYTGPNDALYVGIMLSVFAASSVLLFRRRRQVMELLNI